MDISSWLLYDGLLAIDDVDTGTGNLLDAAAKEVVDNLLTSLGSHYLDGVVATDGPSTSSLYTTISIPYCCRIAPLINTILACIEDNNGRQV